MRRSHKSLEAVCRRSFSSLFSTQSGLLEGVAARLEPTQVPREGPRHLISCRGARWSSIPCVSYVTAHRRRARANVIFVAASAVRAAGISGHRAYRGPPNALIHACHLALRDTLRHHQNHQPAFDSRSVERSLARVIALSFFSFPRVARRLNAQHA